MGVSIRRRSKAGRIIKWTLLILLLTIIILFAIFHKPIIGFFKIRIGESALSKGADGLSYSEHTLTKEQRLTDFEYLYKNAVTDSPVREQAEKYLRADYDEIYKTFKARVGNCKDDYEFCAVMASFMARLPGAHNHLKPPSCDLSASTDYPLGYELGFGDVRETNYAFWKQFEDRMFSYTQKCAVAVNNGGDYVFVDEDYGFEMIGDIIGGKLLTLNGEPLQTAIKKLDCLHQWGYDEHYDCVRVSNLFFNDSLGEKYKAEIEMPDGKIINKDLCCSAEYNLALLYRDSLYPDHNKQTEAAATTTAAASSASAETQNIRRGSSYRVETDASRKLVYIKSNLCLGEETDQLYNDITAALDEVDAENIIVDVQGNKGGDFPYVTEGLCKAIFNEPSGRTIYSAFPKTELTDLLINNGTYTFFSTVEEKDGLMRYSDDFNAEGKAKKKYNVYVLMNASTFSSGDIFTQIAGAMDNVTLLGENTSGEGFTGNPLSYYLPESKFPFIITVGVSETIPNDNYVGTVPDIYCPRNRDSYLAMTEMINDPNIGRQKASTLEYRMQWDTVLAEATKLIDGKK